MNLNTLYSSKRTGKQSKVNPNRIRSAFQRDFDRIIFSSGFRRLQNKTQVFPLPGSVFVHNRLTHSLEVASVGRSLGALIGTFIIENYLGELDTHSKDFYDISLSNVLASACLCHDIGNPAFGHSGEDAISSFFVNNESDLKSKFNKNEWQDFINFEGNANAIRFLTNKQNGKAEGGLNLTYSTLSAIAKYPCESIASDKKVVFRKKFGFFQSCKSLFREIAEETGMKKTDEEPLIYFRHPFTWLVELADDICYNIIDLEDAQKLGIISFDKCYQFLYELISCLNIVGMTEFEKNLNLITNENEKIGYLRAKAINSLIIVGTEFYKNKFEKIVKSTINKSIFEYIIEDCSALEQIEKFSYEKIYNNRSVVEIENAGYNVMSELLNHFIPPILKSNKAKSDYKAIELIPNQFKYTNCSDYEKVMGVLDYVSGMTDNYATELYKRIKGIEIGMKL